MKPKLLLISFLILIVANVISQETDSPNYINGKIVVPLLVDKIEVENHFEDNTRSFNTKNENVSGYGIYTELKHIPLNFGRNGSFKGNYMEEHSNLTTKTRVSGLINLETNLGSITITQSETKHVISDDFNTCDYDYEYSYKYTYTDLKIATVLPVGSKQKDKSTSYFLKPTEHTKLTLSDYKYTDNSKCQRFSNSKKRIFKRINEEVLKKKLAARWPYFNFTIQWDGKTIQDFTKESISVTKVRGEDPDWEPPSVSFLNENSTAEPNSIGVYYDNVKILNATNTTSNDLEYRALSKKGISPLIIADLAKVPGLKILERRNIDKILQEIELSNSGLVTEETQVENKLMKEDIAVKTVMEIDAGNKLVKVTCTISSKKKEILIFTKEYLPLSSLFRIQNEITKEIIKETNEQFNMNTNPEIIN